MSTIVCQTCGTDYDMTHVVGTRDRRNRMFCGQSCAVKFTNSVFPRRGEPTGYEGKDETGNYVTCVLCGDDTSYDTHIAFCNSNCRATYWDTVDVKKSEYHRRKKNRCKHCDKLISDRSITCTKCMYVDQHNERIAAWLDGEWSGASEWNEYQLAGVIRRYLLKEAGYACTVCGFDTPHPSGSTILQVDHIDGHANNHSPNNLTVLCPNCHALTDTYGARNVGNGRPFKRTSVILSR